MGMERRRSPRFPVSGLHGEIHVTFTARLLKARQESIGFETSRPLRIGKRYGLAARCRDATALHLRGRVASCRLVAIRAASSGASQSVYEAELELEDDAQIAGDLEKAIAEGLQESLTVDTAHEVTVHVLSSTGALMQTELELLVGSSCKVTLRLGARPFTSRACVAFVHQVSEGEPPVFHLGVEFHNTAPEEQAVLESYLATLQA
jgi:hypothetical protein